VRGRSEDDYGKQEEQKDGDPGFYVGWRKSIALGELGFTRLVYSVNISQNLISTKGLTSHNAAHRHILSLDMILGND
jgi:hypothetical protein